MGRRKKNMGMGSEPLLTGVTDDYDADEAVEDRRGLDIFGADDPENPPSNSNDEPLLSHHAEGEGHLDIEYAVLADGVGVELEASSDAMKEGRGTVPSSVFNMSNTMLGAGLLTFPYAFNNASMSLALLMLFGVSVVSYEGYRNLLEAQKMCRKDTYKLLAVAAYGDRAAVAVQSVILLQTIGTMTAYHVLIGDFGVAILDNIVSKDSILENRWFLVPMISAIVLLPISLMRSLHALRHMSLFAICAILFSVFCIVERFFERGPHSQLRHFNIEARLLTAVPLMSQALSAHMVTCPIAGELSPKNKDAMPKVVSVSLLLCITLYSVTGVFGQLTFGATVDGNILNSYAHNDVLVSIARVGFLFVIIFSYPVICFTHRANLNSLLFGDKPVPTQRHFLTTIIPMTITTIIALVVPGVAFVFGLNGALCGSTVSMIIPPLLKNKLEPGPVFSMQKKRSCALFFTGCVLLFLGTFATFGTQFGLLKSD